MIQDVVVWVLFAAVVIYVVYGWIRKPKHGSCAKCEFNPESKNH